MPDLLRRLRSGGVLLMDGAMGTQLQTLGLRPGQCYEEWNLTRPDLVRQVHQSYVDAGARCLLTHTFQANARNLGRFGLERRLLDIVRAAVENARAVAGPERFVLADIGPQPTAEELPALLDAFDDGVDAILLETFYDRQALDFARAVVEASARIWHQPVLLSLTYRRDAATGAIVTIDGETPEWFAERAVQVGIAALGVNCGRDLGLADVLEVVRRYRGATNLPLFARPNAGTPRQVGERWEYDLTPGQLAAWLPEVAAAGAVMVGGCCGTTPGYIAALAECGP